jgi:hypothetical protein
VSGLSGSGGRSFRLPLSVALTAVTVLRVRVRWRVALLVNAAGKRTATGGGGASGVSGARLSRRGGRSAAAESPGEVDDEIPVEPVEGGGPAPGTPENQLVMLRPAAVDAPLFTCRGSADQIAGALALRPIPMGAPSGEGSSHGADSLCIHGFGLISSTAEGRLDGRSELEWLGLGGYAPGLSGGKLEGKKGFGWACATRTMMEAKEMPMMGEVTSAAKETMGWRRRKPTRVTIAKTE